MNVRAFYRVLGPGILFAAAAIGVSHLVQSTRAGAEYGLAMASVLLVSCLVKYPVLYLGAVYPAATGKSLLDYYARVGMWAIVPYTLLLLYSMWFVLAAITVTTAGIVQAVGGWQGSPLPVAAALLAGTALLLVVGRYAWLEHVSKWLVGLLAIMVVAATLLALPGIGWQRESLALPPLSVPLALFIVAVAGWMPIPVDASVTTSVWGAQRARERGAPSPREVRIDFMTGYVGATVLALCFLLLGTSVMHAQGVTPADSAGAFAGQVLGLFTAQFGDWAFYLIGVAALATMLSTQLTALDGGPRQLEQLLEVAGVARKRWVYPVLVIIYAAGGYAVLAFAMTSFATFIDYATRLGFLLAPLVVVLNHRAVFTQEFAAEYRPGKWIERWSVVGGVVICATSAGYFYWLFG